YNWSMGNNDYSNWDLEYHYTTGWFFEEADDLDPEYRWHNRLKDDPEYLRKYADRWFHLREEILSDATIIQAMDDNFTLLNAEAAERNFSRWDILNTEIWPNFYYGGGFGCETHTYKMQVEFLKNWLTGEGTPASPCEDFYYSSPYADRLGWIDDHIGTLTGADTPPDFFINSSSANTGGPISVSDKLTMSGSSGTIYYTLDGTDPRQVFSGNAVGTVYTNEITLNKTVHVRARIKNGSSWSALNQAVFADDRPLNTLRITEIMYHPEAPGEEYIELQNTGTEAISLYLCEFSDGIRFTFPDITLQAGDYVLVVENQAVFEAKYGTGRNIAGEFDFNSELDDYGEEIVLRDAAGREIHDFDYRNWHPITDGYGSSLGIIDATDPDLSLWDRQEGWQASSAYGGSPGTLNSANEVATGSIVINEVLAHTDDVDGDWIELHNTTDAPIHIGGWFLSDNLDDLMKYRIPSDTVIAAGGYVVFTQEANFGLASSDPGKQTGFGLSELGESVFLSSGSGNSLSGGYSISENFGASAREVTFGRFVKSSATGYDVDFVSMAYSTKGTANSAPLIPEVVISEIMYNPVHNQDEVAEYIELFNRSRSTVHLFDPANPSNTWKFTKGIEYTFPPGVSIPSGAHILLVRTDPDIFRQLHDIPTNRAIYGPYRDALSNNGEKLELSMPGAPESGFVPLIRAEMINFSDGSHPIANDPWPAEADGAIGYSLQRNAADKYANDVANWQTAMSTPISPDFKWITLHSLENGLFLEWTADGVLQSTTNLTTPWMSIPGATSPFEIIPDTQPAKFFRLQ
ncbi:MAG: lamin tail domain-containing protein, partial [Pontiellaceae bacterium]|nr:lamin tail domain-containing protein [Pontiellaceae bacterium]